MVWSLKNQYNSLFAHLVPTGTPGALIPVMVVIETVRNIIRPGTLSIRLAANMVAGHLLLTLLGSQGGALGAGAFLGLMIGLVLLLCLELAVACIQAYVFTILGSLYLNELCRASFNKKII
jgi:F-type H+-transporting ATPase subunit a